MDSRNLSERVNKLLSENTAMRAEDFCIIAGIDLQDFLTTGIEAAIKVFDTFVETLPPKYNDKAVFKKMLLKNPELVYSMIEASGSSVVSRNVELVDEVKSASNMLDHQRELHLRDLSDLSINLKTERFSVYDSNNDDESTDVDEDDFPSWQITIHCPSGTTTKKITHRVSHYEMSVFFNHATTAIENPDPDYDGADGDVSPLDDVDQRFGDLDAPSDPVNPESPNEWDEDEV